MVEGGLGRFINPKYLRMFGYQEIERLSPRGWAEYFNIAIATGRPEPYGKNSNVAYAMMTFPIQEAEQLMLNDQLPADEEARLEIIFRIGRTALRHFPLERDILARVAPKVIFNTCSSLYIAFE